MGEIGMKCDVQNRRIHARLGPKRASLDGKKQFGHSVKLHGYREDVHIWRSGTYPLGNFFLSNKRQICGACSCFEECSDRGRGNIVRKIGNDAVLLPWERGERKGENISLDDGDIWLLGHGCL